ncbi:MAG: FlgO family outer membrane protein [Spirochaetota bacterium]|nr:FlgO family outer membrane protein [Spirochaetota bacterium]
MNRSIVLISAAIIMMSTILYCSKSAVISSNSDRFNEDEAIERLATDIYSKYEILKNKRIGVFDFSALDNKDTTEGIRLSKKLLEQLTKKDGLQFVERSEIDKILQAQGIEQAGIVDPNAVKDSGKVLSIEVMINGTITRINNQTELSIKVVDISSGEIYLATGTRFIPATYYSHREGLRNPAQNKKTPGKVQIINRTFFALERLSRDRPVIFLLSVVEEHDMNIIKKRKPRLARVIMRRKEIIHNRDPQLRKKITQLREGLRLIKDHAPDRYEIIMKKKVELITKEGPSPFRSYQLAPTQLDSLNL